MSESPASKITPFKQRVESREHNAGKPTASPSANVAGDRSTQLETDNASEALPTKFREARPSGGKSPTQVLRDLQLSSSSPPRGPAPGNFRGVSTNPWMQQPRPRAPLYDPYVSMPLGGQIPYYGWFQPQMGSMGYPMLEGQRPMYMEGGYPTVSGVMSYPPHYMYPGSSEMGNQYPGPGFRPFGPTFLPPSTIPPIGRGRPHRVIRPIDPSESYEFDMSESKKSPDTARRTLMLRNIPNKYTIHMLLEMLDKARSKEQNELVYDFCYLPIDFKNRCNLGYAFVNFVDAESAVDCYKAFHNKRWNDFNSKKVCEVKYARVQGREALIEHFRNSKFPSNDVDSLPLLFETAPNESGEQIVQSVPLHSRQGP